MLNSQAGHWTLRMWHTEEALWYSVHFGTGICSSHGLRVGFGRTAIENSGGGLPMLQDLFTDDNKEVNMIFNDMYLYLCTTTDDAHWSN